MTVKRCLKWLLLIIPLLITCLTAWRIYRQNYFYWLPDYLFHDTARQNIKPPIDIIFFIVDHWEPGCKVELVNRWAKDYRQLAHKHIDSDGHFHKHTFFYPLERFAGYQIDSLINLCREGIGDIEVHLHHKPMPSDSLRKLFVNGIDSLQAHGALISPDGQRHFAFIHGNYALDNSRYRQNSIYCGVNDEISILVELGCYADFTFPSLHKSSQPSLVNKIFYAVDDTLRPKSYETGEICHKGGVCPPGGLMIFPGPMGINWNDWRFIAHPTVDDGNIYGEMMPDIKRMEFWLKTDVHVIDGPGWIFVRPFTHGCDTKILGLEANLGEVMDQFLTELELKYRDNPQYRLHYMTAREAYNVARAAEAGMTGNPHDYRDYILKPYQYPPRQKDFVMTR